MTSAVAAVVLLATYTVVWAAPPSPCFRAQMPNNDDPYSFYKCDAGGKAHLWRCAAGTMYDRRTQICDWEDQVRGRNDQVGNGGAGGGRPSSGAGGGRPSGGAGGGRPSGGAGGNRDKIAKYVAHLDWKSIAHTAAYAYKKVKPILDSMHEHEYDYNKGKNEGKTKGNGKGEDKAKYNEHPEYDSSEESEEEHYYLPPPKGKGDGGRRPNRPVNREPGPTDPDYDNGEDWGEMESWRDQFRESENLPPRDREPQGDRENGGGRNPARNPSRMDCSGKADGPGGAPRTYANPDDCSTYFTCNMRRPVLTYCPRGLNYNPRRRGCDDSEPPNCRTVRGTQTPVQVFVYNRRLLPDDPLIEGKHEKVLSEEEIALPTRR